MQRVEWLKTDLQKPVGVLELKTDLFLHDDTGNMIGIEVTDGGETATLTGTARCYVIRPDTTTVIFDAVVDGNKVYVTLPKEVYYFTGRASFLVRMETEGKSMTLCAFTAIVYRDRTDRISDDERIIPSIDEIVAAIEEMQEVIGEALEKLDDMTASASSLPTGSTPTAVMTLDDGHYHISFGIPKADGDVINDNTGVGDYNLTWSADKLSKLVNSTQIVEAVISAGSWSSALHPTQTISVLGVKSDNIIALYPSTLITKTELDALGFANILCTGQATDSITLTCYGIEPQVNIPISVMILGAEVEGTDITVDTTISPISTNPVQNKVIKRELDSKADVIEATVGNQAIATFNDGADAMPLKELKVAIEPVQDLNGYENPWPAGGGKNLVGLNTSLGGAIEYSNVTASDHTDDSVKLTSTNNTYANMRLYYTLPAGTYTVKYQASVSDNNVGVAIYNGNSIFMNPLSPNTEQSFTLAEQTLINIRFFVTLGNANARTVTFYQFQLETGSSASAWSPYSNICPISGWTGANVSDAGINLWDGTAHDGYAIASSGAEYEASSAFATYYVPVVPNTDYYINSENWQNWVNWYDQNKTILTQTTAVNGIVTAPATAVYARFTGRIATKSTAMIRFASDSNSDYEAYAGHVYSITFPSEAGTVYGGTVKVEKDWTGTLVVDRASVDFGSISWSYNSNDAYFYSNSIASLNNKSNNSICSQYKNNLRLINDDKTYKIQTNGNLVVYDSAYSNKDVFKSAMSGVQLVYELATPVTYTFTAEQIKTLLGMNNIFADTGDIISATYPADTKLYIDGKIAELLNNNV